MERYEFSVGDSQGNCAAHRMADQDWELQCHGANELLDNGSIVGNGTSARRIGLPVAGEIERNRPTSIQRYGF
ncbi:MAG TPA: hypothetical protein PLR07_04875, partial [Promineifilum sp.]|nr:hypothetical protein [Promineifilum sp.]